MSEVRIFVEKSLSEALSSLSEKVVDNFASVRKAREDPRRILNVGGVLQNQTMLRLLEHYSVALREPTSSGARMESWSDPSESHGSNTARSAHRPTDNTSHDVLRLSRSGVSLSRSGLYTSRAKSSMSPIAYAAPR